MTLVARFNRFVEGETSLSLVTPTLVTMSDNTYDKTQQRGETADGALDANAFCGDAVSVHSSTVVV